MDGCACTCLGTGSAYSNLEPMFKICLTQAEPISTITNQAKPFVIPISIKHLFRKPY